MRLGLAVAIGILAATAARGATVPFLTHTNGVLDVRVRNDTSHNQVGCFNLGGVNPDMRILSGWPHAPSSGFATFRVNGTDKVFGDQTAGTISLLPVVQSGVLRTQWQSAGLTFHQLLSFVPNPANPGGPADTLRVEYIVENSTGAAVTVGLRVMLDQAIGRSEAGAVSLGTGGSGIVSGEAQVASPAGPIVWYDAWPSPQAGAVVTFAGAPGGPDQAVFGAADFYPPFAGLRHTTWSYPLSSSTTSPWNRATAFYWNPVSVAAGANYQWNVYVGLPAPGQLAPVGKPKSDRHARKVARDEPVSADASATRPRVSRVTLSPNPLPRGSGTLSVELPFERAPGDRMALELFDVAGVRRGIWTLAGSGGIRIPTEELPRGIYFWRVRVQPAGARPRPRSYTGTVAIL